MGFFFHELGHDEGAAREGRGAVFVDGGEQVFVVFSGWGGGGCCGGCSCGVGGGREGGDGAQLFLLRRDGGDGERRGSRLRKLTTSGSGSNEIDQSSSRGQRRRSAPIKLEPHRAAGYLTALFLLCERRGIAEAARAPARLEGTRAALPLEVVDVRIFSRFRTIEIELLVSRIFGFAERCNREIS